MSIVQLPSESIALVFFMIPLAGSISLPMRRAFSFIMANFSRAKLLSPVLKSQTANTQLYFHRASGYCGFFIMNSAYSLILEKSPIVINVTRIPITSWSNTLS